MGLEREPRTREQNQEQNEQNAHPELILPAGLKKVKASEGENEDRG